MYGLGSTYSIMLEGMSNEQVINLLESARRYTDGETGDADDRDCRDCECSE